MTRGKTSIKLLIILGLVLLTICILNTKVNAASVSKEDLQKVMDKVPDTIELNVKEDDIIGEQNAKTEVKKLVANICNEVGVNANDIDMMFYKVLFYQSTVKDFHTWELEIGTVESFEEDRALGNTITKEVNVIFSNTNEYSEKDEKDIKSVFDSKIPEYYVVNIDDILSGKYLGSNEINWEKIVEDYYKTLLGNDTIEIKGYIGSYIDGITTNWLGESYAMAVFKNHIYYGSQHISGSQPIITKIIVPSNVEDSTSYAISKIQQLCNKINYDLKGKTLTLTSSNKINCDNLYKLENINDENSYVIIEKAPKSEETKTITTTDTSTKIKLDTTTNVVPEGTKIVAEEVKSGDNYNVVVKAVENDIEKFVLYDISLVNNNATIQPNGKVKVSIPVPSGYDTSKIVVYRVAEDGTKTKYDTTIENGYIVFETDHFSNYVVAEEKETETTTTNTTNTTKRELDTTPKTGEENSVATIISSILSLVSVAGIAIVKRF